MGPRLPARTRPSAQPPRRIAGETIPRRPLPPADQAVISALLAKPDDHPMLLGIRQHLEHRQGPPPPLLADRSQALATLQTGQPVLSGSTASLGVDHHRAVG